MLVFPLLGLPEQARPVLLFAGLLLFAMAMDGGWILKGLEQSRLIGVAQVLGQMLFVALVFLLVRTPDDIASAPLAQFGGEFVAALSEALVLAGVLWAVGRNGVQVKPGRLARPLLAAGIMAAVLLYAVPGLSLGLKLVLGCACYLASLLLLGGVPEDARPWLSRAPGAALTRKGKPIVRTRE